jgi:hypothetical protein
VRRCAFLLVVAILSGAASAATALEIGAAMPLRDVRMRAVAGAATSVGDIAGARGTLVLFLCNHCPWVQRWNPRIAAIGNAARKQGIGVVAVNSNDPARITQDGFAEMRVMARAQGYEFPYVVDSGSRLARAFGAERTPEAFLFDAAGRLVYHGAIDDNADDATAATRHFLRDAIGAVIAGKQPPLAQSKSLGCGLKLYPE